MYKLSLGHSIQIYTPKCSEAVCLLPLGLRSRKKREYHLQGPLPFVSISAVAMTNSLWFLAVWGQKATEGLLSLTACLQLYINTGVICRVLLSCSNEPEATSYR